jgi:ubiquinone/menaquinone biosynthesis C-methylase UbiE
MDAAAYDAWYRSPRGAWIGGTEYRLLHGLLWPAPGDSLLDVGCGTGYFTRRFASEAGLRVTGVDPDREAIDYARAHGSPGETYLAGDARNLPFPDASFDFTLSVTALCFIQDQKRALAEIIRVARKGFALGLLNRHSLLFREKGRQGGAGAYRGAHWHTVDEVFDLLSGLAVEQVVVRTAVFLPSGTAAARIIEGITPNVTPWGAFMAVAGKVCAS